jgi:mevalonate kinase
MGRGYAPGKVILVGEHFVVHGTPAIALPLSGRGIEVNVTRRAGPWRVPTSTAEHVRRLLLELGEEPGALSVSFTSELPIGAGLGGSAALAVALVRALDETHALTSEEVRARAHHLETLSHGNPSGVDDAVASYGCPVRYVRGGEPELLSHAPSPRLWVGLTAQRTSTLKAVDHVRRLAEARPIWFQELLDSALALADAAHSALLAADWATLGGQLSESHTLLQALEVSTPALDRLVDSALDAGAYGAKLTGGGLGGAAIAIAPLDVDLNSVWRSAGATEVFTA